MTADRRLRDRSMTAPSPCALPPLIIGALERVVAANIYLLATVIRHTGSARGAKTSWVG